MSGGAPKRNSNAVGHGLYAAAPAVRMMIPASVGATQLAEYAQQMGVAAVTIAEKLADKLAPDATDAKLIGLYAAVSQELFQVAAEIEGGGVKAAPLGQLDEDVFTKLMQHEAEALSLILSQITSAWNLMLAREEIEGTGIVRDVYNEKTGLHESRGAPVLLYLAGHMRSAKRIIREMAANRAWADRGAGQLEDIAERIKKEIVG